jgi:hypothetical protein
MSPTPILPIKESGKMDSKIDPESMDHHSPKFNRNNLIKAFCRLSLVVLVVLCFIGLMVIMDSEPDSQTKTDIIIPFGVKDVSTNTLSEAELSKRLSDGWKVALGAAGTVGFGLLAAGFFVGPLTIGIGLWADYIAGSVMAASAAGGAAYGYTKWHWGGPGGRDGKRDYSLPGPNWEMDEDGRRFHIAYPHLKFEDSHPAIDDHLMGLFDSYGLEGGKVISASYLELNDTQATANNTDTVKRDGASKVDTYSFVYNHTESLISVMVPVEAASEAIAALGEFVNGNGRLAKRADSTWVSFSTYGENDIIMDDIMAHQVPAGDGFENSFKDWFGSQLQPCDFVQCWGGASKGCVAMSEDTNRGENSGIVGEFYTSAYGGIDNECQSG